MNFSLSPNKSFSHFLAVICIIISFAGFFIPPLATRYGLHSNLFSQNIADIVLQIWLFQFLHGNLLHLASNLFFILFAGVEVEARMKKNEFIAFFLVNTIFSILFLITFSHSITIGISGFCMALLAYTWFDLISVHHHKASEFGIVLALNAGMWIFVPNISIAGHISGAVCGIVWWYVTKKLKIFAK